MIQLTGGHHVRPFGQYRTPPRTGLRASAELLQSGSPANASLLFTLRLLRGRHLNAVAVLPEIVQDEGEHFDIVVMQFAAAAHQPIGGAAR